MIYCFIPIVGLSNKTFPRTMDRLDAEFSPDQRLAIYEKVREKSEGQSQADKLDLELAFDTEKKGMSWLLLFLSNPCYAVGV